MGETNKVNVGGDVKDSRVISGNGNTTIDININTIKASQEKVEPEKKEHHVSEKNNEGDKQLMTEIKEIEFVNRLSELQFMTNSIYGPRYILIDSPKGYGKTRLMKAVNDELERQKWLCISINLREKVFSSIGEMASCFLTFLNKEDSLRCDLTHPENAGGEVGRCILQRLKQVNKKDVLIQMDTLEKLDRDLINDLLTKFIPTLASTIHQNVNHKLKIMFAGCYIAEWQKYNYEIPFKVAQLSPFDFDIVHQSVDNFDYSISADMNREYQKDFSAWLMFFTGGHPKSMSEILINNYTLPMNVINNKKKELYEIVKATINNINIHIPSELRDIMERLSVIRRFNARLLKNLIEKKLIQWDEKSEYDLGDLLCQTYLVSRKDGFLQDGITRRLLAINLCRNNLSLFIRIYKQTVSFYEERLRDYQAHGRHIIAVELLFQRLQYISCKTKKINIKQFIKYSEEIIKHLVLSEDSVSVLENFKQLLGEDWEFQFMLNYLFCEGSYDEKPFNELMKTTIDCLENLKMEGKNA